MLKFHKFNPIVYGVTQTKARSKLKLTLSEIKNNVKINDCENFIM